MFNVSLSRLSVRLPVLCLDRGYGIAKEFIDVSEK